MEGARLLDLPALSFTPGVLVGMMPADLTVAHIRSFTDRSECTKGGEIGVFRKHLGILIMYHGYSAVKDPNPFSSEEICKYVNTEKKLTIDMLLFFSSHTNIKININLSMYRFHKTGETPSPCMCLYSTRKS